MLTGSRSRDLTVPLPRNRKLLSCQLSHQQDRTRSMVEDESGNMSDRSRADNEFAAVLGAGANDHKFSLPLGCNVYNFALWPTLTLERFRIKKIAQPFIQDILRCCLLCLLHLILARLWRAGRPQKAFACVFDIHSWTSVDHIEYAQGKRLSCQEHLRRLAHLFDVCTVQTTQYAHSLLLLCFSYRSNQIVNAPTNNISGVRIFREFLEMGRPLSSMHSLNKTGQRLTESIRQVLGADRLQQAPAERMGDALTRVSRYLATAEAFMEGTQLISTFHREEFISDNVL